MSETWTRRLRRSSFILHRSALLALPLLLIVVATPRDGAAQADIDGAVPLQAAYFALLDNYIEPLSPAGLLAEAWVGMDAALAAQGVSAPPLPPLPEGRITAWNAFEAAFRALEAAAHGTASSRDLAYTGIRAMATARRDCHTYFLPPEAMRALIASLEGRQQFVGIGIRNTPSPPFTVIDVIPDSPAERAGLRPGDVIVAVDGAPTADLTVREFSALIRGPRDTPVTLRIQRPGEAELREVTLTRAPIVVPTVIYRLLPDGVGYVELAVFTETRESVDRLRAALEGLEAQGATGWVLDLRRNSGGSVDSMLDVLGLFLPPTPALTITSRTAPEETQQSRGQRLARQRPLAVLVGRGSLSGAEITAAVLQDTGRARLFGERSAGCVSIGGLEPLPDGSGLLVTHSRVLAGPTRRALSGTGVTPDETAPAYAAPDLALAAAAAWLSRQRSAPTRIE